VTIEQVEKKLRKSQGQGTEWTREKAAQLVM
jgi:hypothetical protein